MANYSYGSAITVPTVTYNVLDATGTGNWTVSGTMLTNTGPSSPIPATGIQLPTPTQSNVDPVGTVVGGPYYVKTHGKYMFITGAMVPVNQPGTLTLTVVVDYVDSPTNLVATTRFLKNIYTNDPQIPFVPCVPFKLGANLPNPYIRLDSGTSDATVFRLLPSSASTSYNLQAVVSEKWSYLKLVNVTDIIYTLDVSSSSVDATEFAVARVRLSFDTPSTWASLLAVLNDGSSTTYAPLVAAGDPSLDHSRPLFMPSFNYGLRVCTNDGVLEVVKALKWGMDKFVFPTHVEGYYKNGSIFTDLFTAALYLEIATGDDAMAVPAGELEDMSIAKITPSDDSSALIIPMHMTTAGQKFLSYGGVPDGLLGTICGTSGLYDTDMQMMGLGCAPIGGSKKVSPMAKLSCTLFSTTGPGKNAVIALSFADLCSMSYFTASPSTAKTAVRNACVALYNTNNQQLSDDCGCSNTVQLTQSAWRNSRGLTLNDQYGEWSAQNIKVTAAPECWWEQCTSGSNPALMGPAMQNDDFGATCADSTSCNLYVKNVSAVGAKSIDSSYVKGAECIAFPPPPSPPPSKPVFPAKVNPSPSKPVNPSPTNPMPKQSYVLQYIAAGIVVLGVVTVYVILRRTSARAKKE